jgi:hypothetical protein
MKKQDIKILLCTEVLQKINNPSQQILREIIFSVAKIEDWDRVYEIIKKQMPEVR